MKAPSPLWERGSRMCAHCSSSSLGGEPDGMPLLQLINSLSFVLPIPRDLPVPLLTREYLPAFASLSDIDELKEQVRTLNLLILLLPDLHQRVLKVRTGMGGRWGEPGGVSPSKRHPLPSHNTCSFPRDRSWQGSRKRTVGKLPQVTLASQIPSYM